jgi:hypothetical protein
MDPLMMALGWFVVSLIVERNILFVWAQKSFLIGYFIAYVGLGPLVVILKKRWNQD